MKIVHVISSLGNGGAERLVVDLCNEMSKTEDVTIISFKDVEDWMIPAKDLVPRVKLFTLGKKHSIDLKFLFKYYRLIFKLKPDVVNTHLDGPLTFSLFFIVIFYFFKFKIKFYHTFHAPSNTETTLKFVRKIKNPFFKNNLVKQILISDFLVKSHIETYKSSDYTIIYNGINSIKPIKSDTEFRQIAQLKEQMGCKLFLTIGRINNKFKNYNLLINIAKNIIDENHNILLVLIGYYTNLDKFDTSKYDRIIFLGSKTNVIEYLKLSDAFCMSSISEGLPITMIEAFSVGLPVICTPAGGLIDFVKDYENGFISKDFTEISFYESFKKFLNLSQEQIDRIKENNMRVFKEHFDIEITSRKYIDVYKFF